VFLLPLYRALELEEEVVEEVKEGSHGTVFSSAVPVTDPKGMPESCERDGERERERVRERVRDRDRVRERDR
jgi:hypothetical protein